MVRGNISLCVCTSTVGSAQCSGCVVYGHSACSTHRFHTVCLWDTGDRQMFWEEHMARALLITFYGVCVFAHTLCTEMCSA